MSDNPPRHTSSAHRVIGIFGGSFDPIHYGHLQCAKAAKRALDADEMRLLPCHTPLHKSTLHATPAQRLAMLKLALVDTPELVIDECELQRGGPSYTIDTLRSLRQTCGPNTSLVLVIGWDSLQSLPTWHHWQEFTDYCHLAVLKRPGYKGLNNNELIAALAGREVDVLALSQYPHGKLCYITAPMLDISSSTIRQAIADGLCCGGANSAILPSPVEHYIKIHSLYRSG